MEDVLEVYQRPHDPTCPVVCLDETTKQLIKETRVPFPAKPGQPARHDYEYERNGTINLFMLFAPLEGWRHVKATERHTAADYAEILKELSDTHFPEAEKIVLVQDNLAWSSASNGITHPSTAVGWIWPKRNSASCHASASTGGSPTSRHSSRKSPPGRKTATRTTPAQTGNSPLPMHASS
jgi:hypothetical protein